MIAAGLRSKTFSIISAIFSSLITPVPKLSTEIDTGFATPIAYANSTSICFATPAATKFFATHLTAYAAERSTLVGSFPENAPPPCRPVPPYVSTIIFLPVSPASPCGPPITNRPVGFT